MSLTTERSAYTTHLPDDAAASPPEHPQSRTKQAQEARRECVEPAKVRVRLNAKIQSSLPALVRHEPNLFRACPAPSPHPCTRATLAPARDPVGTAARSRAASKQRPWPEARPAPPENARRLFWVESAMIIVGEEEVGALTFSNILALTAPLSAPGIGPGASLDSEYAAQPVRRRLAWAIGNSLVEASWRDQSPGAGACSAKVEKRTRAAVRRFLRIEKRRPCLNPGDGASAPRAIRHSRETLTTSDMRQAMENCVLHRLPNFDGKSPDPATLPAATRP